MLYENSYENQKNQIFFDFCVHMRPKLNDTKLVQLDKLEQDYLNYLMVIPGREMIKFKKFLGSLMALGLVQSFGNQVEFMLKEEGLPADRPQAVEIGPASAVLNDCEGSLPLNGDRTDEVGKCDICNVKLTTETLQTHFEGSEHRLLSRVKELRKYAAEPQYFGVTVTLNHDTHELDERNCKVDAQVNVPLYIDIRTENTQEADIDWTSCYLLETIPEIVFNSGKLFTSIRLRRKESASIMMKVTCNSFKTLMVKVLMTFEGRTSVKFQLHKSLEVHCLSKEVMNMPPLASPAPIRRVHYLPPQNYEVVNAPKLASKHDNRLKSVVPLRSFNSPPNIKDLFSKSLNAAVLSDAYLMERLEAELTKDVYHEKFELLLHAEDVQELLDILCYSMSSVKLVKKQKHMHILYWLVVPGLAENRPSVLLNDSVYVRIPGKSSAYEGRVGDINADSIGLEFSTKFNNFYIPNMSFDVNFTVNRMMMRQRQRAVSMFEKYMPICKAYIFPKVKQLPSTTVAVPEIKLFNKKIAANKEQLKAVQQVLSRSSGRVPYIIFGPPGTGKTVTMVECIKQVLQINGPKTRILVCASSNSAIDLIAERLLVYGTTTKVLRLYSGSRQANKIPNSIKSISNISTDGNSKWYPDKDEMWRNYQVVACTLICAGRIVSADMRGYFSHIFIDEAGHCCEPEVIIPITGLVKTAVENHDESLQVVLAGDPKQLGPVLRSPFAKKFGLSTSLLQRLMETCSLYNRVEDNPHYTKVITKLLHNYRSHPAIFEVPNELFYEGELIASADVARREAICQWAELPRKGYPIIFEGVDGCDSRESNSPSFYNREELATVFKYVECLLKGKIRAGPKLEAKNISIISPYRKQVIELRKLLRKSKFDKVEVGSVEEFQGRENMVVIVTTVRSNPEFLSIDAKYHLGFLRNARRMNVALTRAVALMIVVGNPFVLAADANWSSFLARVHSKGGYIGVKWKPGQKLAGSDEQLQKMISMLDEFNLKDCDIAANEILEVQPAFLNDY